MKSEEIVIVQRGNKFKFLRNIILVVSEVKILSKRISGVHDGEQQIVLTSPGNADGTPPRMRIEISKYLFIEWLISGDLIEL